MGGCALSQTARRSPRQAFGEQGGSVFPGGTKTNQHKRRTSVLNCPTCGFVQGVTLVGIVPLLGQHAHALLPHAATKVDHIARIRERSLRGHQKPRSTLLHLRNRQQFSRKSETQHSLCLCTRTKERLCYKYFISVFYPLSSVISYGH